MWADLDRLIVAIAGPETCDAAAAATLRDALGGALDARVTCSVAALTRDALVFELHSVGYSAHEISDVISGRLPRAALDAAQAILLSGYGRAAAEAYLDGQYRAVEQARRPAAPLEPSRSAWGSVADAAATRHGLDPRLVRAVIAVESSWNPAAVSRAGAIGLMQLMPASARALGVDPWHPEQNIAGGVQYLASLLRTFGSLELALIAYVAGPSHAVRVSRNASVLYGEARQYVRAVLARVRGNSP